METEGLYFRATSEALATVDVVLTPEDYVEFSLVQNLGAWHLAERRGIPLHEIQALRQQRNDRYSELLRRECEVIEGVRETLESLHGRYRMGIATSSRRDHFEIIHERTGLLGYFDFVVTADEVPETKPNPALYLRALDLAGRQPDDCIVEEDSLRGLKAAHAAGVPCYVIPTEWTRQSDFSLAEAVLENVSGLPRVLDDRTQ